MEFYLLPSNILSNILSLTNDSTIYSVASSCKGLRDLLCEHKSEITWTKYTKHDYDFYSDIPCPSFLEVIPRCGSVNVKTDWTETHTFSMHLLTLMLLHKVDGMDDYDAITSIKVKGDINLFTLTIGQHVHIALDINETLKHSVLSIDAHGYVEVLTPLLDIIPTYCLNAVNAFMSLQSHGGEESIKITKARLTDRPNTYDLVSRTPIIFYSRYLEGMTTTIIIPISCTWSNDLACITFSKSLESILDRIELVDAKQQSLYKISHVRLETHFVQKRTSKYQWLNAKQPHTMYIIPLMGNGGLHNIIFTLKMPSNDLHISGVRWQETSVTFPMSSQE